jgi:hypothetical protein
MAKKFNALMFDKIKDSLKKSEKVSNGMFTNIMKFPAGHTYTIRLIPNVDEDKDETFFHHYLNQWTSKKDGSFVSAISLKTFGERDPINEARWKLYKEWKDTNPAKDEKFENPIKEKEAWFVNIYVVEDPANPENNGKVKILNMGPQLKAIVDDAMTGDSSDEFGAAIFDLSKDGCDFKIKADEQGIYTTYIKSRFSTKTSLDLSDEEIDAIYENVHDLKQVYAVKTFDELQNLLDEHFNCSEDAPKKEERKQLPKTTEKPKANEKPKAKAEPKKTEEVVEDPSDDIPMFHEGDNDPTVDDLLNELDID